MNTERSAQTIEMTPGRVTSLQKINCAYCGGNLAELKATREHVIGRRFVPRGALDAQWNLVLQACRQCNEFLDLFGEDSWRNVYAGELEVRPPGAPTTTEPYGRRLAAPSGAMTVI